MNTECTEEMYEAFKEVMRGPSADTETYADLVKNAIEAALRVKARDELEILGYTREGKPIHPIKPGMIATACTIVCAGCRTTIRGMGGPMQGAVCVQCWEKK